MNIKLPSSLQDTLPVAAEVDWAELQAAHDLPAVNSVRINADKYTAKFDEEEKVPWCVNGRYLHQRPSFTLDPLFHAGAYYVQEASSMFLEYALNQLVDFSEPHTVLDLCAAPGGKSTHMASLMSEDSLLISNEVIGTRVNMLAENLCKWGKDNTWVSNNDPAHFKRIPDFFSILLVDAPCSGSGLFRKMPDYCNVWNTDLVALCAQRQKRILHDVYPSLAQNGLLLYMTCSLSTAENEDMVDFIMQEFDTESCRISMHTDMGIVETCSNKMEGRGYRFFPHLLKGEGFFIAIFRKRDGKQAEPLKEIPGKNARFFDVSRFIDHTDHFTFLQNDQLITIKEKHRGYYHYLNTKIKLVKKGVLLGKLLPKDIVPSHELALYTKCIYNEHIAELDLKNAISYLRKEHFEISLQQKGWYLVTFEGLAIGWLKNLGNRINNYYPSNYRILNQNIIVS